ncbi:hypothetical protein yaldo0001_8620 [Yersinia aldovae ATCC 35236]|nr:hypothetical protein yaldo0001_8620 [Yersinia aldovae ATCC 35236]
MKLSSGGAWEIKRQFLRISARFTLILNKKKIVSIFLLWSKNAKKKHL